MKKNIIPVIGLLTLTVPAFAATYITEPPKSFVCDQKKIEEIRNTTDDDINSGALINKTSLSDALLMGVFLEEAIEFGKHRSTSLKLNFTSPLDEYEYKVALREYDREKAKDPNSPRLEAIEERIKTILYAHNRQVDKHRKDLVELDKAINELQKKKSEIAPCLDAKNKVLERYRLNAEPKLGKIRYSIRSDSRRVYATKKTNAECYIFNDDGLRIWHKMKNRFMTSTDTVLEIDTHDYILEKVNVVTAAYPPEAPRPLLPKLECSEEDIMRGLKPVSPSMIEENDDSASASAE